MTSARVRAQCIFASGERSLRSSSLLVDFTSNRITSLNCTFLTGMRKNLEAYQNSMRTADICLTFSAAHLHWASLHRCYGPELYTQWKNGTPAQRIRLSRQYL